MAGLWLRSRSISVRWLFTSVSRHDYDPHVAGQLVRAARGRLDCVAGLGWY